MQIINHHHSQLTFDIAIVVSRFNQAITQPMLDGALARLGELAFTPEQIKVVWVPGAVEIPLVAKQLAMTGAHSAIVTLGAVVRGETSHYDYVCHMVSQGCQQVALDYDVPVIFGVLTTENQQQAYDRLGGAHGHKARDAIDVACEMVAVMQEFT
jgi:6,7-dimethyl-8-ribityllumazine synthase